MISFRYHLVSLIGVFLALALGIVIGTTALNGPITTDLRKQVDSLKSQRTTLATQTKALQGELDDANQFAATYGSTLVSGDLTGQKVLLIGLPGVADNVEDGIAGQIANAGGTVSGKLQFTSDYVDPRQSSAILALATGPVKPEGVQYPVTSDPGVIGGSLLAYVLVGNGLPTDLTSVVNGFANLHMVTTGGTLAASKTIIVVGTGMLDAASPAGADEIALVNALEHAGANVVVAGDSASSTGSGVVALTRAQDKATVSTVDNADTSIGQVSTILATAGILQDQVGHYGTGTGAQALFPSPPK